MRLWVSEGLFVVVLLLCSFLAFSFCRPSVGPLNPGEVRGRGSSLVEITSSDPISESTPAVPRTVPDADTVTDSDYVVSALNSIDTLLAHPRKKETVQLCLKQDVRKALRRGLSMRWFCMSPFCTRRGLSRMILGLHKWSNLWEKTESLRRQQRVGRRRR